MSNAPVISVVDDDASVRVAADNLLRSLGYTVHTFPSAEEFLTSTHLINSRASRDSPTAIHSCLAGGAASRRSSAIGPALSISRDEGTFSRVWRETATVTAEACLPLCA